MPIKLQIATLCDVPDVVSLRLAANQHLTSQFGKGFWSGGLTDKGVIFTRRTSTVFVAGSRNRLIATLAVSTRKPWAIDTKYFSPGKKLLYLKSMAVAPDSQRKGIGTRCIQEARRIARKWPSDAIRLDANDRSHASPGKFRHEQI